jgi:hypothetical protein
MKVFLGQPLFTRLVGSWMLLLAMPSGPFVKNLIAFGCDFTENSS